MWFFNVFRKVTFDDILAELGEFGLEQKINYFLFSLPYILTSMQLMGWVFVGASFPHRSMLGKCSLNFGHPALTLSF